MIMIDLAEWVINFFIFSVSFLCIGVGVFIFCLIFYAVLDWMTIAIKKEVSMRYYWEVLFSTEYFPYWEFTMLMMLALNLSLLWRVHRIEKKIDDA